MTATARPPLRLTDLANFVNGEHVQPASGEASDITDPSTGEVYARAPVSGPADVDAALRSAAAARILQGSAAGEYLAGHTSFIRREPVGVCAQVTPWNYPMMMAVWKFAPALAAGSTVVLKPSDTTPVTTLMLAEIAAEFLPPGVFNVICGDAATGIAGAGYFNAGQDCTAATRVLAGPGIHNDLAGALAEQARGTTVGGLDVPGADYGPLNNPVQLSRVQGFLDRRPDHGFEDYTRVKHVMSRFDG